ncbi:MAG: FeoB-associated Cys-rich membrane protein [Oscillospiraceae bacterium]|jgi:hypothetical protein|nr:FeoB-associated Cys-rich membrane protein [Oscillospiraceae bacterium]
MLAFLTENLSTIIVAALVVLAVVLIIVKLRRDKKKGAVCSCGDACGGCPASSVCHKEK